MSANQPLQRQLGILLCSLLTVVLVACSPIVAPTPVPEGVSLPSAPLQSVDDYEHVSVVNMLEEVATNADATTAATASQALVSINPPPGPRSSPVITPTIFDHVVNGVLTSKWPAVGVMLHRTNSGSFQTWCSGTLIACDTFLTAAHCVDHNPQPQDLRVFFQNAGFVNVAAVTTHPDFDFPNADVAILRLEHAVAGIRPAAINHNDPVPPNTEGKIVGFGRSGGPRNDYGLKRFGALTTASCAAGFSDDNLICWDYLSPIGPAGTDSNTCNADSGGPLFSQSPAGTEYLTGITSGGTRSDCLAGDHSYDVRVSRYADWIVDNSSPLGGDSCGQLALASGDVPPVQVGFSTIGITTTQQLHYFEVPVGTQLLRITMNGEDTGVNNFDLYARAGAEPDNITNDCASTNSWQYESCEIENPTPGTWHVLIRRVSGAGQYQVVATLFGDGQ